MNKNSNSFLTYILLILLVLYTLKGALYPTGPISMSIAALELGLCFVLALKTILIHNQNIIVNILYAIFILISLSYFLSSKTIYTIFGPLPTLVFFREFCGAVLPFFGMYYLARKGEVSKKILATFFQLLFIATVIEYFYETFTIMAEKNKEFITSNSAYRFVYIMPFVVMLKGNIRVLIFWIISMVLAIMSAKRGTILVLSLECIVYYYWRFKNSRNKIIFIVSAIFISIIGWHYLYTYYLGNEYIQMRVDSTMEGKTSGRDVLIDSLFKYYFNTNYIEILFGSGFANTVRIAGNYAHNDWVEFLIDCGLLGFILNLTFYINLFRRALTSKGRFKHFLWLILVAFFPTSFFSMVFFSESASIGFLWLGLIIGSSDTKRYLHNKKLKIT